MAELGNKACPYCQEEILATAVKCRYCQEWLIDHHKEALEDFIGNLVGRELGNYKITAPIGDGGMGSIWRAKHTTLGREVAIKVLHGHLVSYKEVVKRFLAEARIVVGLGSPYLVEILDLGVLPDGRPYFVMELLEGTPLDQWMESRGVSAADLFSIGEQLLQALSVVHDKGIIHRDLKPSNVMLLTEDGQLHLKLLDFGIAKFVEGTHEPHERIKTLTGMTVGTPVYMSPEQAGGLRDIDARSDIYAAGVLLYHVATGRPPFLSDNLLQIMEMHRGAPVPPPRGLRPDLPKPFEAWLLRCLVKRREHRFQDAQDALKALRIARKESRMLGPTPNGGESLGSIATSRRGWLAGAAVFGCFSFGLWLAWPTASAPGLLPTASAAHATIEPPVSEQPESATSAPAPALTPITKIEPAEPKTTEKTTAPKPTEPKPRPVSKKNSGQRPPGLPGAEGLFEPYKNNKPH